MKREKNKKNLRGTERKRFDNDTNTDGSLLQMRRVQAPNLAYS
jgi:hypothetical protein